MPLAEATPAARSSARAWAGWLAGGIWLLDEISELLQEARTAR
jgi:hypothetical protein